jgi:ABC-type sugar transport system substrate-binding protein
MESARLAAARLIERGVTGMICASDVLALGSIRAARRLGREVPRDVSVVGFDDSALMTCTDPPLTTVRQPIEMMGQAAVDLLVNQIEGSGVAPDELLFEPELVVRGSTAPRHRADQAIFLTEGRADGPPFVVAAFAIASSFFSCSRLLAASRLTLYRHLHET